MVSYVGFGLFIPVGMTVEGRREKGGSRRGNSKSRKGMKTHSMSR